MIDLNDLRPMLDNAAPGPWKILRDWPETPHEWVDVKSIDDDIVASSVWGANARLIAAAPELASEVVRLHDDLREYIDNILVGAIYNCGKDAPFTSDQRASLAYDLTRIIDGDKK